MRILADNFNRYELLTPEKTESVLEEVEGHSMFPIQLPLEDKRPDGTVSDDTNNSSIREYDWFVPVSPEDCDQFLLTKTLNIKLTAMTICSTYGQDLALNTGRYDGFLFYVII